GSVGVAYLAGGPVWWCWFFGPILLLFLGIGHPSTIDVDTPLDKRRRIAAWATIVLFILTFIPVPISFTQPQKPIPKGDTYEVIAPVPAPATPDRPLFRI